MRLKRTTAIVLGLAALAVMAPPAAPAVGQAGEIVSVAEREFEASGLGRKGLDLLMRKSGRVYIVASPGEIAALAALGVEYAFETSRLLRTASEGLRAAGGINGAYHSALELETDLRILERGHPGLARVLEIGETLEKRKISPIPPASSPDGCPGSPTRWRAASTPWGSERTSAWF